MLHIRYHKGLSVTGVYKDNIRFLPVAVGNLLLAYVAYVLPFCRLLQASIGGRQVMQSPYI